MLVNRSIDKNKEKKAILWRYILLNDYGDCFDLMLDENGNFYKRIVYVPSIELCKILMITPRTLRNWEKKGYLDAFCSQGRKYLDLRKLFKFLERESLR